MALKWRYDDGLCVLSDVDRLINGAKSLAFRAKNRLLRAPKAAISAQFDYIMLLKAMIGHG
jgi:hypothetical protein